MNPLPTGSGAISEPVMADMTIAVDALFPRAARVKAVQQGTRVNDVGRQAIEAFAQGARLRRRRCAAAVEPC